jgi:hypothetical protein
VKCATCGRDFEPKAKGRPPKHCPECRKPSSGPIDLDAARARRTGVQREQREAAADRTVAVDQLARAARLAIALPSAPDARTAALSVGLDVEGAELEVLEALARRAFGDLAAGGAMAAGAFIARVATLLAQLTLDRAHLIAPRDLAMAARNLMSMREQLLGDGAPKHAFSSFTVVVKGPGGEIALPPNEPVDS